jgi:hypothetical protein
MRLALIAGLAVSVVGCSSSSGGALISGETASKSSGTLKLENPPPFSESDYLTTGCSVTPSGGVATGAPCFGSSVDDAVVFDCASQAWSSAGCTTTVECPDGGSSCSFAMTVWYPCAGLTAADANCCYLPAVGYGTTPLTAWCISTGSNSFIVSEQAPEPGGPSTGAPDTADAGAACPSDVPLGCSCPTSDDGGVCVCDCSSMPACPASFQVDLPPSCTVGGACMNCLGGASGIICTCTDAGLPGPDVGGAQWQCIPTEEACTGGTFHG